MYIYDAEVKRFISILFAYIRGVLVIQTRVVFLRHLNGSSILILLLQDVSPNWKSYVTFEKKDKDVFIFPPPDFPL